MEAFDRELRLNLHKVSLLCLLAQGLRLSRACSDPLLQARLLSLIPRELHLSPVEKLPKLLRWLAARREYVYAAIKHEEEEEKENGKDEGEFEMRRSGSGVVSLSQILVAILRVLGLRSRLVLSLNPISFRPARPKSSEPLTDCVETKLSPCTDSEMVASGNETTAVKRGSKLQSTAAWTTLFEVHGAAQAE